MNKHAYSTGFGWIILLLFLFGFGLVYVVLNQAMTVYLRPTAIQLINTSTALNSTELADSISRIDQYHTWMWASIPYILFFLILLVAVYGAIKNQGKPGGD